MEESSDKYNRMNEKNSRGSGTKTNDTEGNTRRPEKEKSRDDTISRRHDRTRSTGHAERNHNKDRNANGSNPTKPITHAPSQFKDNDESDKFDRSGNISKNERRGRKMKISPTMDAEEGFHQKKSWILQMVHSHEPQRTTWTDQNEQVGMTRGNKRGDWMKQ